MTGGAVRHPRAAAPNWMKRLRNLAKRRGVVSTRFPSDEAQALAMIKASGLFHHEWYLQRYPDVAEAGADPALHFLNHGGQEKRDPSPQFRTRWYTSQVPEAATSGVNPLVHFLVKGRAEGRSATPPNEPALSPELALDIETLLSSRLLDADWYRLHTPGLAKGRHAVARHYLETGAAEGKDPSSEFDTRAYWKANADVEAAGANPLLHYLRHGREEGRRIFAARIEISPTSEDDACDEAENFEPSDNWVRAHEFHAIPNREALSVDQVVLGRVSDEARARLTAALTPFMSGRRAAASAPGKVDAAPWIADLWFISDHDLRLRLNLARHKSEASLPLVLRVYQREGLGDTPRLLVETPVCSLYGSIVDASLPNPYAPLLLALSDADGGLVEVRSLAFPSLARNGAHHAELTVLSETATPVADLWRLSDALWNRLHDGPPNGLSVRTLAVDLDGAIGGERLFSASCLEWLANIMGIRPVAANRPAGSESLTNALDRAPPVGKRRTRGLDLTIPGDSLPSISALVSRDLPQESGDATLGGYVVADASRARPRWSVFPPSAGGANLATLQPRNTALAWPQLSPAGAAKAPLHPPVFPLAVRFLEERFTPTPAQRLTPTALDAPAALLRTDLTADQKAETRITAIMQASDTHSILDAALTALASQTLAIDELVILCEAEQRQGVLDLAEARLPGRVRVVSDSLSRAALLNQAAAQASGAQLLFIGAGVVLHDPRTVETLATMVHAPGAASVSCLTVKEHEGRNGWQVNISGGGLLPSHLSFTTTPRLILREARSAGALPQMTYAVAANAFRLAMIPRRAWDRLGGLDEARFPDSDFDLDFGLRALATGETHLCTSAIAVTALQDSLIDDRIDVVAPEHFNLADAGQRLAALTAIRELG